MSRHNGRAGKHGVYNPKHNDRSFDVANAESIAASRTAMNLYWDCENGLRTHEENLSGLYPTFTQHERNEYEKRYGGFIAGQNARNIKAGHAKRNRTVDDLLNDVRICPEETIYQIGKEGDCPPPEVLLEIVQEFMDTIEERFGKHVHVLDWALHLDETSPHIHARQVFDVENRYGEIEPKQEKALEQLDIPLPFPDKKPSKVNNRKVTFDSMCRELLLGICREHGLEVETEAIYGGRASREKNDYIMEAQQEKIAELERRNAELTADNAEKARLIAAKSVELDAKLEKLSDADTALDAVSDVAYRQAVSVVTAMVVKETQRADREEITALMKQVDSPETHMWKKDRSLVINWLDQARHAIRDTAKQVFERVVAVFKKPEVRTAAKEQIKEKARPAVHDLLHNYANKTTVQKAPRAHKRDGEER